MRIAGGTVGSYILVTMKCFIPQTMTGSFKVAPKRFINMFSFVFRELKSVLIEISLVQGSWHNVILFLIMHPLFYKAASSGLFQLLWSVWLFYQTITCLPSHSLIWMWMCLEWMFDTTFTHTHTHAHPCTRSRRRSLNNLKLDTYLLFWLQLFYWVYLFFYVLCLFVL